MIRMNIGQLIEELKQYDPDLRIEIEVRKNYETDEGYYEYICRTPESVIRERDYVKIVVD